VKRVFAPRREYKALKRQKLEQSQVGKDVMALIYACISTGRKIEYDAMLDKYSLQNEPQVKNLLVHWRLNYFVALLYHRKVVPETELPDCVRWGITKVMKENELTLMA